MQFRVHSIHPQIFLLSFPTQEYLAKTFLRFQEHYESPEFRGKIFSLEKDHLVIIQIGPGLTFLLQY